MKTRWRALWISGWAIVLLAGTGGCGEEQVKSQQRGPLEIPRGVGKADGFSCDGVCGQQAVGGCWCDEACAGFGDCCPDKVASCDTCPDVCGAICAGKPEPKVPAGCPIPGCQCCSAINPPAPDFCPNGQIVPKKEGLCVVGFTCEAKPCPGIAQPGPGFCKPGYKPVPKKEDGCVVGFDCKKVGKECPIFNEPEPCKPGYKLVPKQKDGCVVGFDCKKVGNECPIFDEPGPDYCKPGYKPVPKEKDGCVIGFDCKKVTQCPAIAQPGPDFCPNGKVVPKKEGDCVVGFTCVELPECPQLMPPPADFCKDGTIELKKNEQGCVIGLECVKNGCPDVCGAICAGKPEPKLPAGCPLPSCNCKPDCPKPTPPDPNFCPNGKTQAVFDANGCPAGLKCLPNTSCEGLCGQKAPGNCWCDAACVKYGDCCADKAKACGS